MFFRLVKKEILEHLMSLRFAIACVLCLLVILSSLLVRCIDYGQVSDDYVQESKMTAYKLSQRDRIWSLPWQGLTLHRAPNPMKILVRGADDSNGGAAQVNAYEQPRLLMAAVVNKAVALFPKMDLVSFVGLIMSLMALVFGYDAICGEKERGTLRLMLSYSVPRHLVLLSKWIGGYVMLIVPFLLTVLVGAVLLAARSDVNFTSSQWGRLGIIVLLAMLYIAVMYTLAILASTLAARASTSIMVLLSLWVILVLGVPNLAPHVAGAIVPARNAQEIQTAKETLATDLRKQHEDKMKAYLKKRNMPEKWWSWFPLPWGDEKQKLFDFLIFRYQNEKSTAFTQQSEWAKIDQKNAQRLGEQAELSRWISRSSPYSCFAISATELADTGAMDSDRYQKQLSDFQTKWIDFSFNECIAGEQYVIDNKGNYPGPWFSELEKRKVTIPQFNYVPPAAGDYASAVGIDCGILAGMIIVFFMLTYLRFLRYDVR